MNINQYRNANFNTLNKAKHWFLEWMMTKNITGEFVGPVHIHYSVYPKKNSDVMNVGSVVDKFFQDSIVTLGILKDDNCKFVKSVSFEFIGYEYPGHVDAEITKI